MADIKLKQEEADRLIKMLKRSLIDEFKLPPAGSKKNFEVKGESDKDIFTIEIYSGNVNPLKKNFGAHIFKNSTLLLELHINPTGRHRNPDGELIKGNHWHIYREGYGRAYAILAEDITSTNFVDNTIKFLDKFNVIEKPEIKDNDELF